MPKLREQKSNDRLLEQIEIQKAERLAVQNMVQSKGWEIVKKALVSVQNKGIMKILETDDEVVTKTIRSDCRAIKALLQVIDSYDTIKND